MNSETLVEMLAERPFIPLKVFLSNGRSHEIRHPEMAIVGQDVVAIGVHLEGEPYPRIRLVDVRHINEVVPLSKPTGTDEINST